MARRWADRCDSPRAPREGKKENSANNPDRPIPEPRSPWEMSSCWSYWWKDEADRPKGLALCGMPCLSHLGSLSLNLPPLFTPPNVCWRGLELVKQHLFFMEIMELEA